MQKSQIKVGEFYAYKSYKHSRSMKVEVINFDARVRTGWQGNTVAGITVRKEDGTEFGATGRQISHTWAEEEAIQQRAREAAEYRSNQAREIAARRAAMARKIEDILASHGEDVLDRGVHETVSRNALAAVGFEKVKGFYDNDRTGPTSVRSRFDVSDFMQTGKVAEKTLTVLLADAEPTRQRSARPNRIWKGDLT